MRVFSLNPEPKNDLAIQVVGRLLGIQFTHTGQLRQGEGEEWMRRTLILIAVSSLDTHLVHINSHARERLADLR